LTVESAVKPLPLSVKGKDAESASILAGTRGELSVGTGETPIPFSATICGEFAASSVI